MYAMIVKTANGDLVAVEDNNFWVIDTEGMQIRWPRTKPLSDLLRNLGYEEPYHFTTMTVT